jgi:hypothetical protein
LARVSHRDRPSSNSGLPTYDRHQLSPAAGCEEVYRDATQTLSAVESIRIRPEIVYAWHGQSFLITNNRGEAASDYPLSGYYFRETRYLRTLSLAINRYHGALCQRERSLSPGALFRADSVRKHHPRRSGSRRITRLQRRPGLARHSW